MYHGVDDDVDDDFDGDVDHIAHADYVDDDVDDVDADDDDGDVHDVVLDDVDVDTFRLIAGAAALGTGKVQDSKVLSKIGPRSHSPGHQEGPGQQKSCKKWIPGTTALGTRKVQDSRSLVKNRSQEPQPWAPGRSRTAEVL